MFLTRKFLPRRTVLRGLGAAVALPLLDAMIPAYTALAQTAAAAKPRVGFIYFPHGAVMDKWTPTSVGAGFVYPICGDMTTMPGLGSAPAASIIDFDDNGEIIGLS